MLTAYLDHEKGFTAVEISSNNTHLLSQAVWLDLFCPEKNEEDWVEDWLKSDIPTREDMREIESSSRLYKENNILYMTAIMIANSDTPNPIQDPVTFILTASQLITIRYITPQSFKLFVLRIQKSGIEFHQALPLLLEFLDIIIDRLADLMELLSHGLEECSQIIFYSQNNPASPKLNYQELLQKIGSNGEINSKARESLVTLNRLITFLGQKSQIKLEDQQLEIIHSLLEDIKSLNDHANFLSVKINFLLDATLGMINIEQNNIIKIFSIAAVIFLPPTLIASIYGMNFQFMPELSWKWGYPFAILILLISAWLPYKYFKIKKWL